MKRCNTYSGIYFLLALILLSGACKKNLSPSGSLGDRPLTLKASTTSVLLTQETESQSVVDFTWNLDHVDTSDKQRLTYYLQWDVKGNYFRNRGQVEMGTLISDYSFTGKDLNTVMAPYYSPGQAVNLDVRLYAVNKAGSAANTYYSNTIPVTVSTYRTNFIVVTGFMANPTGTDIPVAGSVSAGVTHKGGYEYMQLMALKDIDFSKTPYSVVTCNNGSATANGWAEGKAITYKFNLTSGFAAKGTYFYVGGSSKAIRGYTSAGVSTSLSSLNWIRAIDAINVGDDNVVTGDGFGNSNTGFLGNDATPGSGNADGIAVFYGTDVTASSAPIDAVFYGQIPGNGVYNASTGYGYKITNTDHYSLVNATTGLAQPLFNTGTNNYIFTPAVDGGFKKLVGIINGNGTWTTPRTSADVTLTNTSPITLIENGGAKLQE